MSGVTETLLTVPIEMVRQTTGIGLDMGGSVLKFVYRSEDDATDAKQDKEFGHLHLVSFSKSGIPTALEYIKEHAVVTRIAGETPRIYTTGVGCTQHGKLICDTLNVRLENISELDCFVKSLCYLAARLPHDELFESRIAGVDDSTEGLIAQLSAMQHSTKAFKFEVNNIETQVQSDSQSKDNEDLFPCLLVMCGSGIGFFQVNRDGTFAFLDVSNRGGRGFYGIGQLLTGCKDYEELIEMACKGDPKSVDIYSDSLGTTTRHSDTSAADNDDSMYAKMMQSKYSMLIYCFGKAVEASLDDFKREDLARSWLNYVMLDLVHTAHLQSRLTGLHRVLFCGSMCNSEIVRKQIAIEFVKRNIGAAAFALNKQNEKVKTSQVEFIKPGPYLGAIGAVINEIDKFI